MKCMMAFSVLVAFVSVSAGALVKDGRKGFPPEDSPNLSWLTNSSLELKMGGKILNILLTATTNIPDIITPCLFKGKVQEEPLSEVAASGCINSNETLLSISSSQVPGGILDLALVDGITYDVTLDESHGERRRRDIYEDIYEDAFLPPGNETVEDETVEDETVDFFIPPPNPNQPLAAFSGPLPSKVILNSNVKYDNSLLSHFQNSHQKTKDWINRVIGLAKPRMSHNSLSIMVDIQIGGVDHIDETIKANKERIYYLADKRIPSLTSYFCKDLGSGVIGIAFLRAACHTGGYAVNINEMFTLDNSELRTARTYAHELGHNIGMLHDFAPVHGGRGGKCDKQGLMSYGQDRPDQWSTCSNTDYKNWWRNEGFSCMKESTEKNAVLIVGGWDNLGNAEVFFPSTGTSCSVVKYSFSDVIHSTTMDTVGDKTILCGGGGAQTKCYEFKPVASSPIVWTKYSDLNITRYEHTSWASNGGPVLIGGYEPFGENAETTAELDGHILPFSLPKTRDACAITDAGTNSVILTGGAFTRTKVSRYNIEGLVEELPALNFGRSRHGCGSYASSDKLVLIVAGGDNVGGMTTEKFIIGDDGWTVVGNLPRSTFWISGATLSMSNKIYIFGGDEEATNKAITDILEYDAEKEIWAKIGDMKIGRYRHATAVIEADEKTMCEPE